MISRAAPSSPAQRASSVIGVLGGSFDPVHNGHLQLARDAIDQLQLGQLRLIPAAQPWQKGRLAQAEDRVRMLELAVGAQASPWREKMALDLREIDRGDASYTIDTLEALRDELGPAPALILLMGSDQFERLPTWRDWRALVELAHIAIARRNDAVLVVNHALQEFTNERWTNAAALARRPSGSICEIVMHPVDASSTEVRELLAAAPSRACDSRLAALVPSAVLDYIDRHHLYG